MSFSPLIRTRPSWDFKLFTSFVMVLVFTMFMTGSQTFQQEDNLLLKDMIMHKPEGTLSILTANVGNLSLGCSKYLYKLCYKAVEERIARNIQILKPDIITLQEVLTPNQCKGGEKNRKKVCFDSQDVPQVRRLLGNDYSIACNSRNQFECIGVRVDIGEIKGCELGEICNTARTAPPISQCDSGFTVSAITIKLKDGFVFDVVNLHPQSTNSNCRAKMISQIFYGDGNVQPIVQEDKVLLMGDFNFDPWRDDDESVKTWQQIFEQGWRGQKFKYHSGIVEVDPPHYTASILSFKRRTLDFVVSNFAQGTCIVLGETLHTPRLDGGYGMDHKGIFGVLQIYNNP